jgi:hypothetical protein
MMKIKIKKILLKIKLSLKIIMMNKYRKNFHFFLEDKVWDFKLKKNKNPIKLLMKMATLKKLIKVSLLYKKMDLN